MYPIGRDAGKTWAIIRRTRAYQIIDFQALHQLEPLGVLKITWRGLLDAGGEPGA